MLAKLKAKGYLVSIVNMRREREFTNLHRVNVASTYVFFDKGKETHRHTGHLMEIEVLDYLRLETEKTKGSLI